MAYFRCGSGGSSATIDDVVYEDDLKLKSMNMDINIGLLPYNFYGGNAVVLDGEIHIMGTGDGTAYKNHYKWNGSSWTSVSTLPYNFTKGSAVVLDGEIHIMGSSFSNSEVNLAYKLNTKLYKKVA